MVKMKYITLLLTAVSLSAQEYPTLKKYDGLFMSISRKNPDLHYFLIREEVYAEDVADRVKLNDDDFTQAIREIGDKKIHQLVARRGELTHNAIDSLKGQNELRFLNLSGNRLITDLACKKIAENFPRLERLNLYDTSITDKGLDYLIGLGSLRKLHLAGTDVTFDAANKLRGLMESVAGNNDLEITVGWGKPPLASFKNTAFLKSTYQKNTNDGKLKEGFSVKILEKEKPDPNNKYEEDSRRQATDPILKNETP